MNLLSCVGVRKPQKLFTDTEGLSFLRDFFSSKRLTEERKKAVSRFVFLLRHKITANVLRCPNFRARFGVNGTHFDLFWCGRVSQEKNETLKLSLYLPYFQTHTPIFSDIPHRSSMKWSFENILFRKANFRCFLGNYSSRCVLFIFLFHLSAEARPPRTYTAFGKSAWDMSLTLREFSPYYEREGYLASNDIIGLHEGRGGMMWFCSKKGIDIWDGYELVSLHRRYATYSASADKFWGYTSIFQPISTDPNTLRPDSSAEANAFRSLLQTSLHEDVRSEVFADTRYVGSKNHRVRDSLFGFWVSIDAHFLDDVAIRANAQRRTPLLLFPSGLYWVSLAEVRFLLQTTTVSNSGNKTIQKRLQNALRNALSDKVLSGIVGFLWRNPRNPLSPLWVHLRNNGLVRILPQYGMEYAPLPPETGNVTTLFTDVEKNNVKRTDANARVFLGTERGLWCGTVSQQTHPIMTMPQMRSASDVQKFGMQNSIRWQEIAPNLRVHHIIRYDSIHLLAATTQGVWEIDRTTLAVRERTDITAALPLSPTNVHLLALQAPSSAGGRRLFVYHSDIAISVFQEQHHAEKTTHGQQYTFTLLARDIEKAFYGELLPPFHDMLVDERQNLYVAGDFGVYRLGADKQRFVTVSEKQDMLRLATSETMSESANKQTTIRAASRFGAMQSIICTDTSCFIQALPFQPELPVNTLFAVHSIPNASERFDKNFGRKVGRNISTVQSVFFAAYSSDNRSITTLQHGDFSSSFDKSESDNREIGVLEFLSAQTAQTAQTAQRGYVFTPRLCSYNAQIRVIAAIIRADAVRPYFNEAYFHETPSNESALLLIAPDECNIPLSFGTNESSVQRHETVVFMRNTSIIGTQTPFWGNTQNAARQITPQMSEQEIYHTLGIFCAGDTVDAPYQTAFMLECRLPQAYKISHHGFIMDAGKLTPASAQLLSSFTFPELSDGIFTDGLYPFVCMPMNTTGFMRIPRDVVQDIIVPCGFIVRIRSPWWKGRVLWGSLALGGVVMSWVGLLMRGRIREGKLLVVQAEIEKATLAQEKAETVKKSLWQELLLSEQQMEFERDRAEREKQMLSFFTHEMYLRTLGLQMNPHFIFNAMGNLEGLIASGKNIAAQKYVQNFSELIRIIFELGDNSAVSLRNEIRFLELYLLLEQERMTGRFDFHIDASPIPEQLLDAPFIPAMMIQPLIENALKHGIEPLRNEEPEYQRHGNLVITVDILYDENGRPEKVCCIVEDNGVGRRPKKRRKHTLGRASILMQQRLVALQQLHLAPDETIYEDLLDEHGKPSGTRASITFPFIPDVTLQIMRQT